VDAAKAERVVVQPSVHLFAAAIKGAGHGAVDQVVRRGILKLVALALNRVPADPHARFRARDILVFAKNVQMRIGTVRIGAGGRLFAISQPVAVGVRSERWNKFSQ